MIHRTALRTDAWLASVIAICNTWSPAGRRLRGIAQRSVNPPAVSALLQAARQVRRHVGAVEQDTPARGHAGDGGEANHQVDRRGAESEPGPGVTTSPAVATGSA
jgi:hypothetical protein